MDRKIIASAASVLALAVVLGAFGAHALKARLSPEHLGQWRTGVEYQFYHGLGLLLMVALGDRLPARALKGVTWCFLAGIVFFSGSLYLLSTRELSGMDGIARIAGPMTPIGGLFFIVGWLWLLITVLRSPSRG